MSARDSTCTPAQNFWTLQDTPFVDRFTASDLWTECMGSDHCPVWADLDVPIPHLPQGFLPPALSTSHTFAGLLPVMHACCTCTVHCSSALAERHFACNHCISELEACTSAVHPETLDLATPSSCTCSTATADVTHLLCLCCIAKLWVLVLCLKLSATTFLAQSHSSVLSRPALPHWPCNNQPCHARLGPHCKA